jgi:hypothetical protein
MFKCSRCSEKDARIADLKDQVAYLRSQLTPSPITPLRVLEADAILSGNQTTIEIPEDEDERKARAVTAERDRVLSANY